MIRTGDPKDDRIEVSISGTRQDIVVHVSDVDGLTSYSAVIDLGIAGKTRVTLDLFHPEPNDSTTQRRTPLHPNEAELAQCRYAIAHLVGNVALGRQQPSTEALDAIATAALRSSGWLPRGWTAATRKPPPIPIEIKHDPEPPNLWRCLFRRHQR